MSAVASAAVAAAAVAFLAPAPGGVGAASKLCGPEVPCCALTGVRVYCLYFFLFELLHCCGGEGGAGAEG